MNGSSRPPLLGVILGFGPALLPLRLGALAGYAALAVLDARAAGEGDAPRHLRVLRPPQMALMLAGIALALAKLVTA